MVQITACATKMMVHLPQGVALMTKRVIIPTIIFASSNARLPPEQHHQVGCLNTVISPLIFLAMDVVVHFLFSVQDTCDHLVFRIGRVFPVET